MTRLICRYTIKWTCGKFYDVNSTTKFYKTYSQALRGFNGFLNSSCEEDNFRLYEELVEENTDEVKASRVLRKCTAPHKVWELST